MENKQSQQDEYSGLEKSIGYVFQDKAYLAQALRHSSFANEQGLASNERLEFLGDALIESCLSQWLYFLYPNYKEGKLTQIRAMLVSRQGLLRLANRFAIEKYVVCNASFIHKGSPTERILANTIEAVFAAIYLDSKRNNTILQSLMEKHFSISLDEILKEDAIFDPKTKLQEIIKQANHTTLIEYLVEKEEEQNYTKQYVIGLYLNKEKKAEACGSSKKKAEQLAASIYLKQI